MASSPQEWVYCPACHVNITVARFLGHYAQRCPSLPPRDALLSRAEAAALLPTLPRHRFRVLPKLLQAAVRQAPAVRASYKRNLSHLSQSQSPSPPQTTAHMTCRLCGAVAVPGERACYTCLQGGG